MGFLDSLRAAFGVRAPAAPALPAGGAPTRSEGIDGGANYAGRLVFEPNNDLRDTAAYGRAGTYDVGEWQLIKLQNPFVTMALDHVLRPVADARVDVEPPSKDAIGTGPGRISQADADLHTSFVKWCLTEKFPLRHLSKQAADGFLISGFALFEPLAEECTAPMVPGRTVFALKDVPQRLPNSLDANPWLVDDDGRLTGIRQMGPRGMNGQWSRPVLQADRALLMSWKREAGNFAGVSQLRSCWYLAAKVMPRLMKMIGVTLQREGPGVPVATCDDPQQKLEPEQYEEIIEMYANLSAHESSGMVMPAGWKMEWAVSPASNKGHILDVVQRMGMFVLQQFGAQQLMLGIGETGSRSVGETHDARSMAMVQEVLGFLADSYNGVRGEADGLVKRLVDWNFGPQPAYPKVKLTPQRPELSPAEMATAAVSFKSAGLLTVTAEDENAIRERLSLGPIDPKLRESLAGAGVDTALNGAQVTAATDLMQRVADGQLPYESALEALVTFFNIAPERAAKLMQTLKNFTPEPKEPPPGAPRLSPDEEHDRPAGGAGEQDAPSRASNPRLLNSESAAASFVAALGDGFRDALKASAQRGGWVPWRPLRASEERMELRSMDDFLTRSREEYAPKARSELLVMLAMAAPAIQAAMADGNVTPEEVAAVPLDFARLARLNAEYLEDVRKRGATFAREELRASKLKAAAEDEQEQDDKGGSAAEVIEEADEVIEAQERALTRRQLNRVRSELEREAIDVVRTGGDASEVVARTVRRQVETGAFKADAGSVTAKVFNVGRDEAARIIGGVTTVRLTAILDSGTCEVCRSLDGTEAPFNSAEHDRLLPPVRDCAGGDSCRCLLEFLKEDDE